MHIHRITFDCSDPYALANFWSRVTGFAEDPNNVNEPDDPEGLLVSPDGRLNLLFVKVEELAEPNSRVRIDLVPAEGSRDEEVERLLALGAKRVGEAPSDELTPVVLADPEGNHFAVEPTATPSFENTESNGSSGQGAAVAAGAAGAVAGAAATAAAEETPKQAAAPPQEDASGEVVTGPAAATTSAAAAWGWRERLMGGPAPPREEHQPTPRTGPPLMAQLASLISREAGVRIRQLVRLVLLVVEGLIAVRILLKVAGANDESAFASFLYKLTGPLVAPFHPVFRDGVLNGHPFEVGSLLAMAAYAAIAWLLVRLVRLIVAPHG